MEPTLEQEAEKQDGRLKAVELDLTEDEATEAAADLVEFNREFNEARSASEAEPSDRPA